MKNKSQTTYSFDACCLKLNLIIIIAWCNVCIHLGMKILNPLIFPRGGVQPRRRENRPSSITRKFDTWAKEAKRQNVVAQRCKALCNIQQMHTSICVHIKFTHLSGRWSLQNLQCGWGRWHREWGNSLFWDSAPSPPSCSHLPSNQSVAYTEDSRTSLACEQERARETEVKRNIIDHKSVEVAADERNTQRSCNDTEILLKCANSFPCYIFIASLAVKVSTSITHKHLYALFTLLCISSST